MEMDFWSKKPGRPKAIPDALEPAVVRLYELGCGYRRIAKILREQHGANPSFSSVKRVLARRGILNKRGPNV